MDVLFTHTHDKETKVGRMNESVCASDRIPLPDRAAPSKGKTQKVAR